ncbi:MAG: DUF4168 domain-containing protein [Balneolaceae bacterium]
MYSTTKVSIKFTLLFSLLIAFAFTACQEETAEQSETAQDMMNEDPFQQQQSVDIEISDEELDEFLTVVMQAQEIQMGSQQEMITIVEDHGLDVLTYNRIAQGLESGQSAEDLEISDSDMESFQTATTAIEEIQVGIDEQVEVIADSEGMEMDRLEQINMAMQQDPELQQRAQQRMAEMQGAQMNGMQSQPQNGGAAE